VEERHPGTHDRRAEVGLGVRPRVVILELVQELLEVEVVVYRSLLSVTRRESRERRQV